MSNYLRILKKYGILFEDKDGRIERLNRIPNKKDGETFKQWKVRTFGKDIEGLKVYVCHEPSQQTRMVTLSKDGGADNILRALKEYRELTDEEVSYAIDEAVEEKENEITQKLTTIPKEMLRDILKNLDDDLELPANEFFQRFLEGEDNNIKTEEILSALINTYNDVVKQYREKST
jgi:myo-inositol-1-phosphate synthase